MKGQKTGGRKKGTPNKVTSDLKAWINQFIQDNKETFEEDFHKIDPDRRVQVFEKLLSYAIPKMQAFDIRQEFSELERLLDRTPDEAVEQIARKIIELNSKNRNNEQE